MEDLPSHLLVEILSSLRCSADLASCRLASRTLHSLSYQVSSISLLSPPRNHRSNSPNPTIPFKTQVLNVVSLLSPSLQSLSLTVQVDDDGEDREEEREGFDDDDDLHLTAVDFLSTWLHLVGGRLRSLAISDYWSQSCFRCSFALALISYTCNELTKLELRNAWLSVNSLQPMPKLTNLTLDFIRLDDENLSNLNESFPFLQVLNLINVGGLKDPKIHLSHLTTLHWRVSNIPQSLSIHAPNLTQLELHCVEPKKLCIEAPRVSDLKLTMRKPGGSIYITRFLNLKSLRLESKDLRTLFSAIKGTQNVKKLEINVPGSTYYDSISISDLHDKFEGVNELELGEGAWFELQNASHGDSNNNIIYNWVSLRRVKICLGAFGFDTCLLQDLLKVCPPHCEIDLLFSCRTALAGLKDCMTKCASEYSMIRLKCRVLNQSGEEEEAHQDL